MAVLTGTKFTSLEKMAREAPVGTFFIAAKMRMPGRVFRKSSEDLWVDVYWEGAYWVDDLGIARMMEEFEESRFWVWWLY